MKNKKQEIGTFTVINELQEIKNVIVSQDEINYYSKEHSHKKNLYLETIDGPEVFKTEDPNIFKLQNGSILKRKSR